MKKILFLLTLLIFSCSSSDNSSEPDILHNNGQISANGQTYFLNNASITKWQGRYIVNILSSDNTTALQFILKYNTSTPFDNLYSGTFQYDYTHQLYLSGATLIKNTSSTVFNENDFLGTQSRVIVNTTGDNHYIFDYNFITTLGVFNGNFTGNVTKIDF